MPTAIKPKTKQRETADQQSGALRPEAVVQALATCISKVSPEANNAQWTTAVLSDLARSFGKGLCVDPVGLTHTIPRDGQKHEWLWDLTISEYPDYAEQAFVFPEYFAAIASPELVMVVESEWGKEANQRNTGLKVMEDFIKLLAARCPLKVMIFAYHDDRIGRPGSHKAGFVELRSAILAVLDKSQDDAAYVLFGIHQDGKEYSWAISRGEAATQRERAPVRRSVEHDGPLEVKAGTLKSRK